MNEIRLLVSPSIAPLFAAPDLLSEQVSQALIGDLVEWLEEQPGWVRIRTRDDYTGWCAAAALQPFDSAWEGPMIEVEDLWVNLRPAPDSETAPVTHAFAGCRFPLVEAGKDWWTLKLPGGRMSCLERRRAHPVRARPLSPQSLCRTARRFLGVPYLWGGCSPFGLDCSGFVQRVYFLHGLQLPRDASDQAPEGREVEDPLPADLVFFGPSGPAGRITHVGMMLDERRFIHAHGGRCVRLGSLDTLHWRRRHHQTRRYLEPEY